MNLNGKDTKENKADGAPARIVLYSHDTCGLGHLRRNLLIARTIRQAIKNVNILLLTGAREATSYSLPHGIDVFSLPAYTKVDNDNYGSRFLDLPAAQFQSIRSDAIHSILQSFQPDCFIVDKVPRGTLGELDVSLAYLKQHTSCRCVLGLRDILDDPKQVHSEWAAAGNFETIRTYYDAVWIYGDPVVYNPEIEYGFPEDIREKMTYTGYLGLQQVFQEEPESDLQDIDFPDGKDTPFALCAVGGGKDGFSLAEAFVQSTFPAGLNGVLLTGPHMPPKERVRLNMLCKSRPHIHILQFHQDPVRLYRKADRVVCMGGYNTMMELLSLSKKPLVAPRINPRIEQLLRVQRFERLGLVDHLDARAPLSDQITSWFQQPVEAIQPENRINMQGLSRLISLINQFSSIQETYTNTQTAEVI